MFSSSLHEKFHVEDYTKLHNFTSGAIKILRTNIHIKVTKL